VKKIARFAIWICRKFTRVEIEEIIKELSDILADRNPEVKPRDDFKEKHPNYRRFFVDPLAPLRAPEKIPPGLDWKELLSRYQKEHRKELAPVNPRKSGNLVPKECVCRVCSAPAEYLYFNDGKKRSQVRCKVCGGLSQVHPGFHRKTKYLCPHCQGALYLWKEGKMLSIYKCCNDKCPTYLSARKKLNLKEKLLAKIKSSQFKLRYCFREYRFRKEQLRHSAPAKPDTLCLFKIRNSLKTLSLLLTFNISLGLSARKTAFALRNVFGIPVSYQTVLNYTETVSYYCHQFNLARKGTADDTQVGDEAYIKVLGENAYTFFFLGADSRKITAYHLSDNREVLPATTAMQEAIRTTDPTAAVTLVTDGNPSYPAGIHFINQSREPNPETSSGQALTHKKVIGLQNLDSESAEYRPFKQLIERLNRTYKFHTRAACGFKQPNGAVSLTTLFVTYYNFLRPHTSLRYKVPIPLKELEGISLLQDKWAKIILMATDNLPA